MRKNRSLSRIRKLKKSSICLGLFDGVHLGHQKIIAEAVKAGARHKIPSLVVTLDPHPTKILNPKKAKTALYSLDHRLQCFEKLGVNRTIVIPFTKKFSMLPAQRFIEEILIRKLGAKWISVGNNYRFGRKAVGNVSMLRKGQGKYGYKLKVTQAIQMGGSTISSTRIRHLITQGHLKEASSLTGRPVSLFGQRIPGMKRGRRLGYPTINLRLQHEVLPPPAVYAVKAVYANRQYKAVFHLGPRPTYNEKSHHAEVHLIQKCPSFRANTIEIILKRKLRNIKRFPNEQSLKTQIKKDIQAARKIL